MRHILNLRSLFLLSAFSIFAVSCKKVSGPEPLGDAGEVFVKVVGGAVSTAPGIISRAVDFVSTPSTVAVGIQRLVTDKTDLEKTMTVTVLDDTSAVNFFNRDTVSTNPNATNPNRVFYEHLPAAWYTVGANTTKTGGRGGIYTLVLKPGEFIKDLNIIIPDATLFNPSAVYALGFTILSVNADGKVSKLKSGIMTVGAKNNYDGVYSYVSGLVTRYTAPGVPQGDALSGPLGPVNPDIQMITTGAYKVRIPQITWSGGTSGVGGIGDLELTVDPVTNLVTVTSIPNAGGPANATLTNWAGKVNRYDPATKTFYVAFRWNPTANVREYEVVWRYKGPR